MMARRQPTSLNCNANMRPITSLTCAFAWMSRSIELRSRNIIFLRLHIIPTHVWLWITWNSIWTRQTSNNISRAWRNLSHKMLSKFVWSRHSYISFCRALQKLATQCVYYGIFLACLMYSKADILCMSMWPTPSGYICKRVLYVSRVVEATYGNKSYYLDLPRVACVNCCSSNPTLF